MPERPTDPALVIEERHRQRCTGHLERGDVFPDQAARHVVSRAFERASGRSVQDIEVELGGGTEPVDEHGDLVSRPLRHIREDRLDEDLGRLVGGQQGAPTHARFTVEAEPDLDLIVGEVEREPSRSGHLAR